MSLSLCVRPFIRSFVVILSDLEHLKHLKQDVSKVLLGCLMGVSGCLKGVSRKFQGCFMEVSRVFQRCFNGASRMLHRCVKCVFWLI